MSARGDILVTGAAGFIGSALVESLLARGLAVRALVRRAAGADGGAPGLTRVFVADLRTHSDWASVLDGVAAVVHLAGAAHLTRGPDDPTIHESSNVVVTERLAAACADAGVRRFVFVSSAKVNGERSSGRPFSEDDPPDPHDAYARSKLDAEKRLLAIASSSSLEPVILRPPLVYGPGVKANFLSLLRAVDAGLPLPLARVRNRRSFVYVGNLASAIEACLAHPGAAREVFFVADESAVSTHELALALARGLGRPARVFAFPPSVLGALAALAGQRARLDRLTGSLELDTAKIRARLGWRPPYAFADGIAETCRWFAAARR